MPSTFGQFCPVALASEILMQKWMLLIIREMNAGSTRFNDIRRGVPRISATLLKQRLDQLERAGVIYRRPAPDGQVDEYVLTVAGEELKAVLQAIGVWGQRWARDIDPDDLDPGWLVWSMHRRLNLPDLPAGRTVIEIAFTDTPADQRFFWLVCDRQRAEVCVKPTGFEVDLRVITPVQVLAEVWRGIRNLKPELSSGRIRLEGDDKLKRKFPDFLLLSGFAGTKSERRPLQPNQAS